MAETVYEENRRYIGENDVVFIKDGIKLVRIFQSPFEARAFVNKAKRSKKIKLVSYPRLN